MPIIRCPECRRRYDPGSGVDEALEHRPDNASLKVACPACGQWVRLPEREPCPAPNASAEMLKEMMAQSRLVDDDDRDRDRDRPRRKSASRMRADDNYEDDDDDWEDRPLRSRSGRRTEPRKNNTVLIVLGILGGVFLVVLLSCGGLFYIGYTSAKQNAAQQKAIAEANLANVLTPRDDFKKRIKANTDQLMAENRRKIDEFQQNINANIDSEKIADDFIRLLRDKKTKDAYQLFTNKLKQKFTDVAALDDLLAKLPSLAIFTSPMPANFNLNDSTRHVFTITIPVQGKLKKLTITMAKVDTKWMVDDLTTDLD